MPRGCIGPISGYELRHRLKYPKRIELGENASSENGQGTAGNGLFALFSRNNFKNEMVLKKIILEKNQNFKIFDHLENVLWDFHISLYIL